MKKLKMIFALTILSLISVGTMTANDSMSTKVSESEDFRCKIVHKENGVRIKVVADTCEEAIEAIKILTR
ncbi:MAG: hypothetical protein RLP13_13790 [Cytophagales bacterium]